ncbi:T-cell surface glycoprotein CD8 beta chain [Phacochoerus africanus]|uniref:T-cell surface glycoprotein CD8 beta chain n=1 Tax=Phacochoerus africanus TaxID=41426 RepID=UPI001FD8920B|nr:T-cell surface glycoprotein CD8 beta chain [Phacochoerus africanus]
MQPRLWLLIAAQLSALHGGSALMQTPPSMMAQTNQTVKLSCEARTFPTNTRIYWLRLRQALSANSHYEFLALWIPNGNPVYGKETEKQLTVLQDSSRYLLQLRHVKPADSGNYFCMAVGNPELTFGKGTRLSVVDVFPTTVQPTKKTRPKKKICRLPNLVPPKGPACAPLIIGLLVAGLLVLLVSLGAAVHVYCLQRRAWRRLMKQFCK